VIQLKRQKNIKTAVRERGKEGENKKACEERLWERAKDFVC